MIEQILSDYNLPQTQLKEPITNGLINQTWRIKNSSGDFILQRINHEIFKDPSAIAANLRMLADYLARKYPDYLFIVPIKTKNNEEIAFLAGEGYFRISPYVQNSHTINAAQSPDQAFEAARKFGEFTRLLSNFPVKSLHITLPDFHNLSLRYQQFSEALQNGNKIRLQQSQELINFIKENQKIVAIYEDILHNPAFKL